MSRSRTGLTVQEAERLPLKFFERQGSGKIAWESGTEAHYRADFANRHIRLTFEKESQTIHLVTLRSNLGNGDVYYFLCPQTGRRARVLYRCNGSPIFMHRQAYQRLFYTCQVVSKNELHSLMYWRFSNKLNALYQKAEKKSHYRGKLTATQHRIKHLQMKRDRHIAKGLEAIILPLQAGCL